MGTRAARAGIAAAAVAAVVGLFLLASRNEGTTSVTKTPPAAQGATGGQSKTRSATKTRPGEPARPAPKEPTIERIVVRGGKPVGGVKRLVYEHGERVRFSVRTDVADEVHIHGFDIEKALPANRRVRFVFSADIEGVFEVELHGSHTKIAELRVTP